jgi:hypothetical protein
MAQWGNTDDAANSVIWAVAGLNKTANTANRNALFGNTTPDAYFDGVTIGQYGVDVNEAAAARATVGAPRPVASGWVLRTEGSGGRAGRVQMETLVAMRSITGDAEDAVFPDFALIINTQPVDATANADAGEEAFFTVFASSVPAGANIQYEWEYTTEVGNLDSFATANVVGFSDETTDTLSVLANTIADGTAVRVVVYADDAANVVSDIAVLTVTVTEEE